MEANSIMEAVKQLDTWRGEFGKEYTDRNVVDWHHRLPAFSKMLEGLQLRRVLEVGCNRGHNLRTVQELLGEGTEIFGVEPNPYALSLARSSSDKISAVPGNIYDLPFKDGYFDLVFTTGVLIHIPPTRLAEAISEIARVSRRYILAVEYYAEEDTSINYRGHEDLLWKRNFLKHYEANVPGLSLKGTGDWDKEEWLDRGRWWLMEKSGGAR
jgi:pseudaminic acid biosynthesis-associated methylase